MADIQLNHQSVDQAVNDMIQATQQMTTNLEDLLQGLDSMKSSFTGAAADAWTQFQNAANQADNAMKDDFGKGHVVLADMHATLKNADAKGATVFGG